MEVLTAVLSGAAILSEVKSWVADTSEPTNEGHAFIAIDVGRMMPIETFNARMDQMIREIKGAPRGQRLGADLSAGRNGVGETRSGPGDGHTVA